MGMRKMWSSALAKLSAPYEETTGYRESDFWAAAIPASAIMLGITLSPLFPTLL